METGSQKLITPSRYSVMLSLLKWESFIHGSHLWNSFSSFQHVHFWYSFSHTHSGHKYCMQDWQLVILKILYEGIQRGCRGALLSHRCRNLQINKMVLIFNILFFLHSYNTKWLSTILTRLNWSIVGTTDELMIFREEKGRIRTETHCSDLKETEHLSYRIFKFEYSIFFSWSVWIAVRAKNRTQSAAQLQNATTPLAFKSKTGIF